jgi:hypothetical protein
MLNVKTWFSVSIGSFILSAICTVVLFTSGISTPYLFYVFFGMAVIQEICKSNFFAIAILNTEIKMPIRALLFFISICLFVSSIVASSGLYLNETNKSNNKAIENSDSYKQAVEKKDISKSMYNLKLEEIEDAKEQHKIVIAEMKKDKDNLKKGYWGKKLVEKENEQQQKINNEINIFNKDLSLKNSELKSFVSDTTKEININNTANEEGFSFIFSILSQISKSDKNVFMFYFFLALNIISELIALLSLYLYRVAKTQKNGKDSTRENDKSFTRKDIESDSEIQKLSVIQGGLDVKKVKAYLEYMYNNSKNNVSIGYQQISEKIKIKEEDGRKIKSWLEGQGVLKSENGKTKILKEIKIA